LLNFLKKQQIFNEGNVVDLGHISGIILFHQPIEFDNSAIPQKIASWFHVTDIQNVTKLLYQITSKKISLSDEELLRFPKIFDLKQYEFERPKIDSIEKDLKDKEKFIEELSRLIDILASIDIAKKESDKVIERHDEFINHFYPKRKPEELNYNLNNYHKNYEAKQQRFIQRQEEKRKNQIELINNLNSNNGFVLNEFTNNKDLKECLLSKIESNQLIRKIQQKFQIKYSSNNIGIFTLEAYKDIFFERGIFDENVFVNIRKEILKKENLINYLHALYVILNTWFSDDMILQHEFSSTINTTNQERKPYIKEYKFARGISGNWYINLMNKFKEEQHIVEYYEVFDETVRKINPKTKKCEPYKKHKFIAKVKIPFEISSLFRKLRDELSKIIENEELNVILNLCGLSWIGNKNIDVRTLHVINLKTHLIFSNLKDIDFLKIASTFPNSFLHEPFYIACLEQIGQWGWKENISSPEIFKRTYKCLAKEYVSEIDNIISKWSFYKVKYKKGLYPYSNFISIGKVSKECKISPEELIKFLDSIGKEYSNKLLVVNGNCEKLHANYDYKILLKQFKTYPKQKTGKVTSHKHIKPIEKDEQAIIGYTDIKEYIEQHLKPYKNPEDAERFGLKKTAGIILYGPPGCGKTYWANWISKFLELPFEEIYRSHIGSSYVDGAMKELDKKLNEIEKKSPLAIFFDEFDSIGKARESISSSSDESRKVVNTLLQRIPKLIENGIVILAATNFINDLDSAVIRPGRFDLHIPIFPPLPQERAEIIIHYLTENSPETILEILNNNYANEKDYWIEYSELMYLFSNSHVIDFCEELKGYIYNESKNIEIEEILFTDDIIKKIINLIKSKIRKKDVELYIKFYQESNNLMETFKQRMERLKYEIDKFNDKGDKGYRPIGFKI